MRVLCAERLTFSLNCAEMLLGHIVHLKGHFTDFTHEHEFIHHEECYSAYEKSYIMSSGEKTTLTMSSVLDGALTPEVCRARTLFSMQRAAE